jgi:lysophospholipid acyltransferase (LPLAT)-like uncharacterized protein
VAFDALLRGMGFILGSYFTFCRATSRMRVEGLDEVEAALKDGPVLIVVWHGRQLGVLYSWRRDMTPCISLTDPSPAGRMGAAAQRRFTLTPVAMPESAPAAAVVREIFRALKSGKCLAMTADGPLGPARQANASVATWIRKSGRPVFYSSWSVRPARALGSWDSFLCPLPFGRGVIRYARFDPAPGIAEMGTEDIRAELTKTLCDFEDRLDAEVRG